MMLRITAVLAFSLGLVAVAPASYTAWTVRPNGVGPVRIGMTRAELGQVLHVRIDGPGEGEDEGCYYSSPNNYPGIAFMIENGRLSRVDLDGETFKSVNGIGIGDSEAKAVSTYGQKLTIEPNPYDPEDHDLTFLSPDGKYGIKFLVQSGKIREIYAGQSDSIALIEGCA